MKESVLFYDEVGWVSQCNAITCSIPILIILNAKNLITNINQGSNFYSSPAAAWHTSLCRQLSPDRVETFSFTESTFVVHAWAQIGINKLINYVAASLINLSSTTGLHASVSSSSFSPSIVWASRNKSSSQRLLQTPTSTTTTTAAACRRQRCVMSSR